MKRNIGFIVVLAAVAFALFSWKSSFNEYRVTVKDEVIKSHILFKGLNNAVDFTSDMEGNYYIAFKDRLQYINKLGKSYNVFADSKLNITSLDYKEQILYYASQGKVYSYNVTTKENKEIIKGIPNYGDYNSSLIKIYGEYLFVTIGSATNSGVVGQDNLWLDNYPENHDVSPKSITIKGINFGKEKTGAFVSYKTSNIKGQIISEHIPGNSSIIIYNLVTGAQETFAWGIRNMKALDVNSEGKILVTVGGMEDRGARPVKGDSDYIYQIKKNKWYGFPDYTGGDPINSPKFKGLNNGVIPYILQKHPTTNPPAPIYQHKTVDSLVSLAIDKKGVLGDKDCIYFYERNDNSIYSLNKINALKERVNFGNEIGISSMKFFNNLIVLDTKEGYLISFEKNNINGSQKEMQKFIRYLLVVVVTLIVSIVVNLRKKV
jgi:hypothetical protein